MLGFYTILKQLWEVLEHCRCHTCSSSLDSLVSGYFLCFRTISVVEMNPAVASTCTPSVSSSLAPAAMTVVNILKALERLGLSQQQISCRSSKLLLFFIPPSTDKMNLYELVQYLEMAQRCHLLEAESKQQ